ncbi:MAG: hypothetical protein HYX35_02475 [Proteobacteria bacterium]|nr:hypothetical protein [Pseudomonadota bacterium]
MKIFLTTTAALSVGLTLGVNQPIQAQSPYSAPNGEGTQVPSTDNTPYPQQGAAPEGTTARGSSGKSRALTVQQLQNKANSGKRLTPEELQQIQDVVNEQANVRMRSNTPVGG